MVRTAKYHMWVLLTQYFNTEIGAIIVGDSSVLLNR
jgi:hypothetical protein